MPRPRAHTPVQCTRCAGWGFTDGFLGRRDCSRCDSKGFTMEPVRRVEPWQPGDPTVVNRVEGAAPPPGSGGVRPPRGGSGQSRGLR